jgi:hypothetical protein
VKRLTSVTALGFLILVVNIARRKAGGAANGGPASGTSRGPANEGAGTGTDCATGQRPRRGVLIRPRTSTHKQRRHHDQDSCFFHELLFPPFSVRRTCPGTPPQDHLNHGGAQLAGVFLVELIHILNDLHYRPGLQVIHKGFREADRALVFGYRHLEIGQVAHPENRHPGR